MKRKDQISGAFWLFFSLIVIQQSLSMELGNFRNPGPGLIPLIWGGIVALLSIINIIKASLRFKLDPAERPLQINWYSLRKLVLVIGILIVFTFIFPHLGFFFCVFWVLVFLFRDFQKRWVPFLAAALTVILSYLLFHVLLQIQFPRGPWGLQ